MNAGGDIWEDCPADDCWDAAAAGGKVEYGELLPDPTLFGVELGTDADTEGDEKVVTVEEDEDDVVVVDGIKVLEDTGVVVVVEDDSSLAAEDMTWFIIPPARRMAICLLVCSKAFMMMGP